MSGKEPGYSPPVIYEAGGKRQLIVWHPAALVSLDPENGKQYWTEKRESKMGPRPHRGHRKASARLISVQPEMAEGMPRRELLSQAIPTIK